jgi:hypothetical protein
VEDVLILTPLSRVLYRQRDHGLSDRDGHFFLRIREGKGSEATLTYPRTVTDSTQNLGRSHWLLRARTLCGRVHLGVLGYLLSYACILQGASGSKPPSTFLSTRKEQFVLRTGGASPKSNFLSVPKKSERAKRAKRAQSQKSQKESGWCSLFFQVSNRY